MMCMYYSIVHTRHIHGSDIYIHVYARWVGFQMSTRRLGILGQKWCLRRPHQVACQCAAPVRAPNTAASCAVCKVSELEMAKTSNGYPALGWPGLVCCYALLPLGRWQHAVESSHPGRKQAIWYIIRCTCLYRNILPYTGKLWYMIYIVVYCTYENTCCTLKTQTHTSFFIIGK